MTAFPLALAAGETHEEGMSVFLESERDLPAFYREHGWRHAETRFAIVATVVVYGSFSDATCEAPLRIIAIEDLDG
jgi:hypothetical protein